MYNFFHEIVYSPDIFNYINSLKIPLLFFKGKKDEVIPISKTDEMCSRLDGKIKLIETGSQKHFFNHYWRFVQEETIGFFEECRKNLSVKE